MREAGVATPPPADVMGRFIRRRQRAAADEAALNVRVSIRVRLLRQTYICSIMSIEHTDPVGQIIASSAGINGISASAGTSINELQYAASAAIERASRNGSEESQVSLYDLLWGLQGDITSDDLCLLAHCLRKESDVLEPEEELVAALIRGQRVYCTVVRQEHLMAHSAITLRLRVVWIDGDGDLLTYDVVRLRLSAADFAAAWHLITEMTKVHITPLAHKLAELYGPCLDVQDQALVESEANA